MSFPRIDVEKEMQEVVRQCGGIVLEDHLKGAPDFQNADFIFHSEKLIFELKCLTEDNIFSATNQEKIKNIWRRCHIKKLVSNPLPNESEWKSLPKNIQNEIYEIRTRTIKKRAQKANIQIRQTKAKLSLPDYTGILIIVNDGITSLSPPAFIHATQLALKRDFKEIRHFIFLTLNIFSFQRQTGLPTLFWICFDMEDGTPVNTTFMDFLGKTWRNHCSKLLNLPINEEELEDIEGFWRSKNIPPGAVNLRPQ